MRRDSEKGRGWVGAVSVPDDAGQQVPCPEATPKTNDISRRNIWTEFKNL